MPGPGEGFRGSTSFLGWVSTGQKSRMSNSLLGDAKCKNSLKLVYSKPALHGSDAILEYF